MQEMKLVSLLIFTNVCASYLSATYTGFPVPPIALSASSVNTS
jgi:hypothetical protein